MFFHSTKQGGFTLIEVIIALAISSLIFLLLTSIYIIAQNTYKQADAKGEITQNGRVILDRMVREIRQTPDIITQLPSNASDTAALPSEIMFQDGHNMTTTTYIRYFLDQTDNAQLIRRQVIVYYFPSDQNYYVHSYDTDSDPPHNPPISQVLDDRIIGEYADDIEFWGNPLTNINLYLSRNGQSAIISTAVYGRNL